jgi:thermolysin
MWGRHGYAGIDGNGKRAISVVNYGPGGGISQNNAFFNAGLDVLSYGIAGGNYRPFCAAQDIVAHEFTHGFTAHTSGLIYQNQPGALNESMSDVFGYLVEAEYQNGGDWTEGEDIRINGGASRSFSNPPIFGDPDNINHPYFVPYASDPNMFTNDFGGVHSNSGIPNKVLYLVVQGDEHYGVNVAPLEIDIAESRYIASDIWFNWNAYYLGPEDDFSIGREKMLQVVQDLWPANYSYYQTVANAWASVGVGSPLVVGDINGDMIANIQDIIIMIGIATESLTPTETQSLTGDLNSDGIIDILDIILVVNIIFNS